jgi:CobQ-like glutamine amidotransferase family enzyme
VLSETEWGTLVAFENHSGRTFLGEGTRPFGRVVVGHGNNGKDGTEGAVTRNAFGCYLHGSLLPKNPAFADHLIRLALRRKYGPDATLAPLDDVLETEAHTAAAQRAKQTR